MRIAKPIMILLVAGWTARGGVPLTVGDVTYENATLSQEYPSSLFIRHSGGTAFVDRSALNGGQLEQLRATASPAKTSKSELTTDRASELREAKRLLRGEDEGGNWARAVGMIRKLAEQGYPAGQYEWGAILVDGFCVTQDTIEGEKFIRMAGEAGDAQAIREMALRAQDPERTAAGIRKAADAGDGQAMVYLLAVGGGGEEARTLLDRVLESGDAEAIVQAASILTAGANSPAVGERLGMTKDEAQSKALEAYRAGREENVLDAYSGLAHMLRHGIGVDKNELESRKLMDELRRKAEQRGSKGSIGARISLLKGLQNSGAEGSDQEVLRLATEVLANSSYSGHRTVAALLGARSLEGNGPKSLEGAAKALAWLKERQSESNDEGIAGLVSSYEKRVDQGYPRQ